MVKIICWTTGLKMLPLEKWYEVLKEQTLESDSFAVNFYHLAAP